MGDAERGPEAGVVDFPGLKPFFVERWFPGLKGHGENEGNASGLQALRASAHGLRQQGRRLRRD